MKSQVKDELTHIKVNELSGQVRGISIAIKEVHKSTSGKSYEYYDEDLAVGFPIEKNVEYFVLSVEYTTGNSFGRDPEPRYDYIGLYKTFDEAELNAKYIRAHNDHYTSYSTRRESFEFNDKYNLMLISPSGTEYKQSAPWMGYFEHLVDVRVDGVSIDKRTGRY